VIDEATDKLLRDLRDSRTDLGKLAERPHEPTADRIRNRQHDDGERRKLGSERAIAVTARASFPRPAC